MPPNGRAMHRGRIWEGTISGQTDRVMKRCTPCFILIFMVIWLGITFNLATRLLGGAKLSISRDHHLEESRRLLRPAADIVPPNDMAHPSKAWAESGTQHTEATEPDAKDALETMASNNGDHPVYSYDDLHGSWVFDEKIYDWPLRHPNATLIRKEDPRIILIKNFLSSAEVEHLQDVASSGFSPSEVVSDAGSIQPIRSSQGSWLNGPRKTEQVKSIEHRIANLTHIPEEFGESIHVLRYEKGQKYNSHTDHCHHPSKEDQVPSTTEQSCIKFLKRAGGPGCGPGGGGVTCGDRVATLIMYLKSPTKGGATVFPKIMAAQEGDDLLNLDGGNGRRNDEQQRRFLADVVNVSPEDNEDLQDVSSRTESKVSDVQEGSDAPFTKANRYAELQIPLYCREDVGVLKVMPSAGDAVLFYGFKPGNSETNGLAVEVPASLHGGCPPLEGEKVIATRWMRSASFA